MLYKGDKIYKLYNIIEMKIKNILKFLPVIMGLFFLLNSCDKAQVIHPASIPENGVYISGSGIYIDSLKMTGLMDKGKVLSSSGDVKTRDSLFQKFMFIKASGNFSVSQQIGAETVVYGLSGSLTEAETGVFTGDIVQNGTAFTVSEDGFYLFAIDLNTSKVFLFKISSWYLSGDAVVEAGSKIDIVSGDVDSVKWSAKGIKIQKGEMNFRFYSADTYAIDGDSVKMVTYLGGAFPQPELGGDAFSAYVDAADTFSFSLKYDNINQFASSNSMPAYDPRIHTYGLIGSAFYQGNDPNNDPTAWDTDFNFTFDASSDTLNNVYNFVIKNQYFIGGEEFKIRLDGIWDNGEMGYAGVDAITGDAANISNAGGQYGNFKVGSDAQYDVTFTFNTKTYKKTIDFTKVQ